MTVAKFCPECGTATQGAKFCPECGTATTVGGGQAATEPKPAAVPEEGERDLWTGSPDPLLDALAARSTKYVLTTERLKVQTGMIGKRSEQMDLFRVKDVSVRRNLAQRARKCGDIVVASSDASSPKLLLSGVKEPDEVAERIRTAARGARQRAGVRMQEYV